MDSNLKENNFALPISKSNYEALKKAESSKNNKQHIKYLNVNKEQNGK